MAAPYGAGPAANNNNNAWGIANTPTGCAAAGPLSTIYAPNVDAVPAPGTVVIRLNGRVEVDVDRQLHQRRQGRERHRRAKRLQAQPGRHRQLHAPVSGLRRPGRERPALRRLGRIA